MTDQKQIAKWHEAHPDLHVPDIGLETMAPFASLHAIDFITYIETQLQGSPIPQYCRALLRELVWAYDGWTKAQHDADPGRLIDDMINNCNAGGAEAAPFYAPVRKFLADYAGANGIKLRTDAQPASWMVALEQPSMDQAARPTLDPKIWPVGGATVEPPPPEVVFGADGTPVDNVLAYKANASAAPGL